MTMTHEPTFKNWTEQEIMLSFKNETFIPLDVELAFIQNHFDVPDHSSIACECRLEG